MKSFLLAAISLVAAVALVLVLTNSPPVLLY